MLDKKLASLRLDYKQAVLLESAAADNPIEQFTIWWQQTLAAEVTEPNAMALSTLSKDGFPEARIVLLKSYDESGFIFFTNYESNKAHSMASHTQVGLLFYWKELERQVRIQGTVAKISEEDSTSYFQSRPKNSQIGAWASPQSTIIADRSVLDKQMQLLEQQYKDSEVLPRPPHWGGYIVKPSQIEFWQGRSSRLHDRLQYNLGEDGKWTRVRLAP